MRRGFVVANRFEIEHEAGEGGMGTVYRAFDRLEKRTVALKILRETFAREAERFQREARMLAELEHPAIVRYVAHGTTALGQHYLVMEWLEGEDLATRMERQPLAWSETLVVLKRICSALAAAHERGLVHRDVKPNNVFLPGGQLEGAKLLDFGIARDLRKTSQKLTNTGVPMGTPEYMSPEQARGSHDVDPRADVFALGCVLFELLTGRVPFEGESPMAVLAKILLEAAPRPSDVRPEIPPVIDALVARMLAKDRSYRPPDAAAVLLELHALERETAGVAPQRVGTPALTASERRVLSVLLVGELDADHADTAPDYVTKVVGEIVQAHGGTLETLADGCLMVILRGADAPTDQAVRAARCALGVRRYLRDVPMALATGRGERAGGILVGELIDRIARGFQDEHRLARETLVDMSETKPIRIDDVTAALLDERFDVRGDEAEGLRLFGEIEAREADRTLLGRSLPMLGRDAELATLEQAYDTCALGSSAAGVLVIGQPGVGKSRLRRELIRRLATHPRPPQVLVARGDFDGAGAPLSMLAGAVRTAAGILTSDGLDVQRAKLGAHVARVVSDDAGACRRVVEFLGEMIGAPVEDTPSDMLRAARADVRLMHDAMRSAWEDWLAAEAHVRPIVLVLDDLQWADMATIEFVDASLRTLADQPFFVLALARPGVRERLPSLWADRDVAELVLGPLSRDASAALVREALGSNVAPILVERLVDRADGNAFYLEELVRSVAEGRGDVLPESVVGMVQSRLEAIGDDARRVLRAASVFGQRFWAGGVHALLGESVDADGLRDALAHIVSREIVSRRPTSSFEGETEYAFRSGLVRDAAYELLTEADRVTGHRLAGRWLSAAGERDPLVLGEHFLRGQEHPAALDAFHRAAAASLDANDFAKTLECVDRAIACHPSSETAGALRLLRAEALSWLGRHDKSLEQASDAAASLPRGTTAWFNALSQSFTSLSNLGDYDRV
ncbi:MAG: protein kinase, partial [Deltaproteobacteria bacterium]|nr:protein kinase [Deltaproteobacteria bacterium]